MEQQDKEVKLTSKAKPRSRKALEYRVFWLERKLSHIKEDRHRNSNAAVIDKLPDSDNKQLMHLNNEFNRAKEQTHALSNFTESLNQDSLRINERNEQLSELTQRRNSDADRLASQTKRLLRHTQHLNQQSEVNTEKSITTQQLAEQVIVSSETQNQNTRSLNQFTQAQHKATRVLNEKTQAAHHNALRTTDQSVQLNQKLDRELHRAEQTHHQAETLEAELLSLKAELELMGHQTNQQQDDTRSSLKQISIANRRSEAVSQHARKLIKAAKKQLKINQLSTDANQTINDLAADKLTELAQMQCDARATFLTEQEEHERLRAYVEQDHDKLKKQTEAKLHLEAQAHQKTIRSELAASQAQVEDAIANMEYQSQHHQAGIASKLSDETQKALSENKDKLASMLLAVKQKTDKLVGDSTQTSKALLTETEQSQRALLDEFDVEAHTALSQFETENRQLINTVEQEATDSLASFNEDKQRELAGFQKDSENLINAFSASSSQLLDESHNAIIEQTQAAEENFSQSQSFITETKTLQQTSQTVIAEANQLNQTSKSLQDNCQQQLSEIIQSLELVSAAKQKLLSDHHQLKSVSESLNAESGRIQTVSKDINTESIKLQNESLNTQELSQQINSHSLSLHEETRNLNQAFESNKQDNLVLITELESLKTNLGQQQREVESRLSDISQSIDHSEQVNQQSEQVRAASHQLSDEIHQTLAEAKRVIKETSEAGLSTQNLHQEIHQAYVKLKLLEDEVKHANAESRTATQQARQSVLDAKDAKDRLNLTAVEVRQLQADAETAFKSLDSLERDTKQTNSETRVNLAELKQNLSQSHLINEEFLRGLEASSESQKQSEQSSQTLMEETHRLQTEIRDILSLKDGFQGFQSNLNSMQQRFNELVEGIDRGDAQSAEHSALLEQFQNRIISCEKDLNSHSNQLGQFGVKAAKLDTEFDNLLLKVETLDQNQEQQKEHLLSRQQQALTSLKTEIQDDILAQQHQFDISQKQIENLANDLSSRLKEDLRRQTSATEQRLSQAHLAIHKIDQDLKDNSLMISGEVKTLQSESAQLRQQTRELQHLQESQQAERQQNQDSFELEIGEIKQRLKNYQQLLQTQVENDNHSVIDQRIHQLEATIADQRLSLDKQENAQQKLIDQNPQDQLKKMMNQFGQSMDEATELNKALKLTVAESDQTNKSLAQNNHKLQQKLALAQREREQTLKQYAERIKAIEERESQYQKTISKLRVQDSEAKDTMHQMRSAMQDSTAAMRDTQATLEKMKSPADEPSWFNSSRQAVLNSVTVLVIFTMAIAGFDRLGFNTADAAMSQTAALTNAATVNTTTNIIKPHTSEIIQQAVAAAPSAAQLAAAKQRAVSSIGDLGEFSWPVNFGVIDPNAIKYQPHRRGISIAAEFGDPVVAVNDGKVVYSAKEIRGYGNVIVIQHDPNLVSVYANNQFNYVKEGDQVSKGQLIGDIGQLFDQEQAGLYFEMRYMGQAEDPFNYLSQDNFSQATSAVSSLDDINAAYAQM